MSCPQRTWRAGLKKVLACLDVRGPPNARSMFRRANENLQHGRAVEGGALILPLSR